ncbi:hypothetical protein K493DRAFT_340078 [Basidiobolus meristosporus CBS 931.73]|uniref:Peptidase C51 domain-containing protein n=1 Tax=Basidiobolus meristosporus CBS 931.73 TaxID=1314790 RepID=A0A1Y1XX33_9FUNG|nr:hypothetical protein K493DRAFT_340078 [Basidiobolus meristosporus CBS 931.73]|eukprot:ORX90309.1 hypothetical protein K493DRAFT_340078 [Basidiobolus meristosporus CBS 931.73]
MLLATALFAFCALTATDALTCPDGNGLYCGNTLGLDSDVLYNCDSDSWSWSYNAVQQCSNGCVNAAPGSPDYCAEQNASNNNNDNNSNNSNSNSNNNNDNNSNNNNNNTNTNNSGNVTYTNTLNVANYPLVFRFDNGQCTDWADARYAQITGHHVTWWGDARFWAVSAREAGWVVSKTPKVPSIIVIQPGYQGVGSDGHVAVVEEIMADGSVYTSDYNYIINGYGGPYIKTYVTFYPGNGVDFIWY